VPPAHRHGLPRRLPAIAACLVALAAWQGCGEDEAGSPATAATLASRLPADSATVYFANLDAVREDLGLDPGADAIDVEGAFGSGIDQGDPLQRLVRDAGTALPTLAQELAGGGQDGVLAALDGGRVHAIASTGPGEIQLTAIATSQDFGSIAETLTRQGYTRDGSVLVADSPASAIGGVADTGDGIIVLAGSEQQARNAVGADEPSELAGPLDTTDEPVRVAAAGTDCISSVSVGQAADASSGSVTVELEGDADAGLVDRKALLAASPGFDFTDPDANGSELTIGYSGLAPKLETATPLETLVQTFGVYSAYNCKP
jgi:hypothetical protein